MTLISIKCEAVNWAFASSCRPELVIQVDMTREQMKAAVHAISGKVTDAEWAEWVRQLAADVISEERTEAAELARQDFEAAMNLRSAE